MDISKINEVLGDNWKIARTRTEEEIKNSKKEPYFAQCHSKVKHTCIADAMKECRQSKAYLEVYRCKICGYYHVGKNKEVHKITTSSRHKRKKGIRNKRGGK